MIEFFFFKALMIVYAMLEDRLNSYLYDKSAYFSTGGRVVKAWSKKCIKINFS